jgi:hypothetical protein
MLGISRKNPNVLFKYLGGLKIHLWKQGMLFKPRIVDEAYVQEKFLENIVNKDIHVLPNKKTTNMILRNGRRSRKKKRRRQ